MRRVDSTEIILESISDGVFTVDAQWRITSFNRAAEQITGISRDDGALRILGHDTSFRPPDRPAARTAIGPRPHP